jgi:hypothetical protein
VHKVLLLLSIGVLSAMTLASVVIYQREAERRALNPEQGTAGELSDARAGLGRDHRALPAPSQTDGERRLTTLVVGDVLIHNEEDWVVDGRLRFRDEDLGFTVLRLFDGSGHTLFLIPELESDVGAFLDVAHDVPTFGRLANTLTHSGKPYRLSRRGDALVEVDGQADPDLLAGRCQYALYAAPGRKHLLVVEKDEGRLVYSGDGQVEDAFLLMPGDGKTTGEGWS